MDKKHRSSKILIALQLGLVGASLLASLLATVPALAIQFSGVAKRNGIIWRMPAHSIRRHRVIVQGAAEYCESQGGYLPSIEELARNYNELGMRSSAEERFRPILIPGASNASGVVGFYYNPSTYSRPHASEADAQNWFWSETLNPRVPNTAYTFSGATGAIRPYNRDDHDTVAVICVLNPDGSPGRPAATNAEDIAPARE